MIPEGRGGGTGATWHALEHCAYEQSGEVCDEESDAGASNLSQVLLVTFRIDYAALIARNGNGDGNSDGPEDGWQAVEVMHSTAVVEVELVFQDWLELVEAERGDEGS